MPDPSVETKEGRAKRERRIAKEAGGETADLRLLAVQVDGIADRLVGAIEDQITLRRAATELRVYDATLRSSP